EVETMRKVGLLLATIMVPLLTTSMMLPLGTKYIVKPGDVVDAGVNSSDPNHPQQLINGSVTLTESPLGSDAATANTGGGCLIYLQPGAKKCTVDSDCTKSNSNGDTVVGYCADTGHNPSTGSVPKRCWYKPAPAQESCVRGKTLP